MRLSAIGPNLLAAVFLVPLCCAAQDAGITAKLHPWGTFDPGAWKTVRVVSESLDEHGQVASITTTDTKTMLLDIDNDGITLEIEACMELAGKRFEAEPQMVCQGFCGELLGQNLKFKETKDSELSVEGRKIPCKVQRVEATTANGKTLATIYYSPTVAPYILKRESVTTDSEGKNVGETSLDTLAFNMPVKVRGQMRNGIYVKTVHKTVNGSVTTFAVVLPDVPGGVVFHSSKEVDKSGRLVRRNMLEVVDYNSDPDKDGTGLFGRKRSNRRSKQNNPR